jgi:hypothetical protein
MIGPTPLQMGINKMLRLNFAMFSSNKTCDILNGFPLNKINKYARLNVSNIYALQYIIKHY